ncbi:MAG: DUF5060 domain-containing protein [Lentisphaeria bacterium]|nr:DUF5060 domain-containing protein [Lentisphaeria bacterium]
MKAVPLAFTGTILLGAGALPGAAPDNTPWRTTPEGVAWHAGDLEVRLQRNGEITLHRQDRPLASLAFFHWHGPWIYERLEQGTVLEPLAIAADNTLTLAGTWGTKPPAPPLAYTLTMQPRNNAIDVRLSVRKTGPLHLTAGLWAAMSVPRRDDETLTLLADPGMCAPVGKTLSGPFRRLFLGRPGQPSLSLEPGSVAALRSRITDAQHNLEICLRRGEFTPRETVEVRFSLGDAIMPPTPPDPARPRHDTLALRAASGLPPAIGLYEPIELHVDLTGTWDNPYDPDDVRLDAHLADASGRTWVVPGFFMVPHRRLVQDGMELMLPENEGRWCVRLTPMATGSLRCRLAAADRNGSAALDLPALAVEPSTEKGFLRVSRADPRYLVYDSGAPYLPIGHNLPIYPAAGQLADEALAKMAGAGENFNRWWMSSSGLGIEWEAQLGRYRQLQAARLDAALAWARDLGFSYMMCMDTHQDFRLDGWRANPFNARNGGPCATVAEWFTNETARKLYRKRLRYTVARWGYSTAVLCWEFGNEFEGWENTPRDAILDWHREMAQTLKSLDPFQHPVTTSWWSKTGPEEFWELPDIDIVQTHCYTNNNANVAEQVRAYCLHQRQRFGKPHIFGEFGIRSHETTADKDPKGWALHNAFWAALCSGCDGIPMPWWHENYIDPLDLYFHFAAIRAFTRDLPFGSQRWDILDTDTEYADPTEADRHPRDVELTTASGFRKRGVTRFAVAPDGSIHDPGELLGLLHGQGHADLRAPPSFEVTFPEDANAILHVGRVSHSGLLRVFVDEKVVLERDLACGPEHGKSWQYRPRWQLWESVYDEDIPVPVPAGAHLIRVENHGKDWIEVTRYTFQGCRRILKPDLLAAAISCGEHTLLWLQNRESTWYNHARNRVPPVPGFTVALRGLPPAIYEVEWWDTWRGAPQNTETVAAEDGILRLTRTGVATDLAARIRPARDEGK